MMCFKYWLYPLQKHLKILAENGVLNLSVVNIDYLIGVDFTLKQIVELKSLDKIPLRETRYLYTDHSLRNINICKETPRSKTNTHLPLTWVL